MKKLLREKKNLSTVYAHIVDNQLSMITPERFMTIDRLAEEIYDEGIEGDIVECGCWRGGMSIYMAYAFPDRHLWAYDSFEGFEETTDSTYPYADEKHTPLMEKVYQDHLSARAPEEPSHRPPNGWVPLAIPYEKVVQSFLDIGLSEAQGITITKGFVNKTLKPETCKIEKIALLRIDVDAYSATRDVLENLFDKVVPGGYVIFDDTGIDSTTAAIWDFDKETANGIIERMRTHQGKLLSPATKHTEWGLSGNYIKKDK
tara:strand:+ start:3594 stop:4370 length:777 start_codon:yes stop_codon:yes gene_type:complete